jgi:hypothetical protein
MSFVTNELADKIIKKRELEQLTQKIIKAVPSIKIQDELEKEWNTFHYRPITLEDVMIALLGNIAQKSKYNIDFNGTIWVEGDLTEHYIYWLLNTPLHLQSEETISELNKLIK